jgi:hypothetical protein
LAVRFQDNDDIDREVTDAAIWFDGGSNYTIDHNTFLHDYHDIKACEGTAVSGSEHIDSPQLLRFPPSDVMEINTGDGRMCRVSEIDFLLFRINKLQNLLF